MQDLSSLPRPPAKQSLPVSAKKVFEGKIFSVYQWEQELYDGSKMIFEKISRKDSVGILAVTEDKKILLTKQEQPSIKPFQSILGGVIDEGELPFITAQRELLEEAGATAKNWKLWFATQPAGKIDWANYVFIAQGCTIIQKPELDGGEKITLKPVTFDEFLKIIFEEDFRDQDITLRVARMMASGKLDTFKKLLLNE